MSRSNLPADCRPQLVRTQMLREDGLKIAFSDGTCIFLKAEQILANSPRQPHTAPCAVTKALIYCCYDGCQFCS